MRKIDRPECPEFMRRYLSSGTEGLFENRTYATGRSNGRPPDLFTLLKGEFRDLRKSLIYVFSGKCCYCESELGLASDGDIEQFRPKSLYPHLAADWRNLYLSCSICNRSKGVRFPLKLESAQLSAGYDITVAREAPMLLDPCHDDPAEHLAFTEDGQVAGLTERGQTTVQVLALNRRGLVTARSELIARAKGASDAERRWMTQSDRPYSGVINQFLKAGLELPPVQKNQNALLEQQLFEEEWT